MNQRLPTYPSLSHYRLLKPLGAGGMGEVWLAEDTRLDRQVAVKLLPAEFTQDAERLRRFSQEAKAASSLNHPNIITVHDIGESETGRFIVMELVAGNTLRTIIAQDNSIETVLALGQQIAKALSAAHTAGITHRDIKPDNIMVRDDGYVKVLDFGLARLRTVTESDSEAATLAQQTTPGTVMGTVAYMSPEQARGEPVNHPSDVFALGIVLYELATGRHPFKAETLVGYLHAITLQEPAPPQQWQPKLPAALNDLLLQMLAKEASQRPTASEVAQALQAIERGGDAPTPRRSDAGVENETMILPSVKSSEAPADEGFWVAVLPFKWRGANAELEALAEGLAEDIVTGLSHFSYLRVIARSSTVKYANDSGDVRAIGKELGARYVMEGSLRQAGSMLRVAVQLVDASTGAHLWAESYDRQFRAEDIFALQDDLVPRIVSTVADQYGALVHSMSELLRGKSPDQYSAHEAVLRTFSYLERITPEEHAEVRAILEVAVARAPGHSDCLAMLAMTYYHEHAQGYNLRPDPLGRALATAQRAVAASPSNPVAHFILSIIRFFQKDFLAFRQAAERALVLNPMDASTSAFLGILMAYAGDWEEGLRIAERAKQLNPHHPGWYHLAAFYHAYRQRDYRNALATALKINMPGYFWTHVALAAVYGQLGEHQRAHTALQELRALKPDFGTMVREQCGKWFDAELTEHLIEGLRKAGLEMDVATAPSNASPIQSASGEQRTAEGFWVAVLPFKATGSKAELSTLAEGLTEDTVTGLSRFSYLRVIARGSTLKYASDSGDVRAIGKELGARYVMEGSLRQAGATLRVAVQLVDATTGAHIWAETYDRQFRAEDIFALQDELTPQIVSTVADQYGALVHSMTESLRGKSADSYSAHEAVLRAFGYLERISPEEHAEVRAILEAAVAATPGHSNCYAMLSLMYWHEYANGYNVKPDPLGRAYAAAQQAVAAAPTNQLAHYALANVLFYQKDFPAFRPVAERALALNRMDASTTALIGTLIAYAGDWEAGLKIVEQAQRLNPNHPGWYHLAAFYDAYRRQDYRNALDKILRVNMPGYYSTYALLAATYGQLGEQERARAALQELRACAPKFGAHARSGFSRWFDAELTEQLIDGLRKAGLVMKGENQVAASSPLPAPEPDAASRETADTQLKTSPTQSIAVLPFANISADEENEYFCDGLAEELLNALAKIDELKVAARTSAFSFKGKNAEAREIGKTLNVNTVLEGSVRKAGNRIRINVQLVNAADGYQLWSERYNREMKDIFDVQDEITLAVVDALKVKLLGAKKAAVLKRYTENTEAYQLYLQGQFHFNKFTEEGWWKAVECYKRAIALEPDYAPAFAGIAYVYVFFYLNGVISPDKAVPEIKTALAKALALDQTLPESRLLLGWLKFLYEWDWEGAEKEFKQALALNPNNTRAVLSYGYWLAINGRRAEAVAKAAQALELDPLSLIHNYFVGLIFFFAGEYERLLAHGRKLMALEPCFHGGHMLVGFEAMVRKDYDRALPALEAATTLGAPVASFLLGCLYGILGQRERAQSLLNELQQMSAQRYVLPLGLFWIYAGLGEMDRAFECLERAYELRDGNLVFLKQYSALIPGLSAAPRLADLLRRIGLPTDEQPQADESLEANTMRRIGLPTDEQPQADESLEANTMLLAPTTSGQQAGATWAASSTQRHTVGRERERHELCAAFNAANDGRGSLLCVAGEPGIGKTTLVEDFLTELATTNQCTIARGRCSERLAGTEAYLPLLEALESLLAADVGQDLILPHTQKLKQLAPTWYAQVMPLAGDSEESARLLAEVKAASQERMKRELASFLSAVATPQPLVIFFDDLHWADVSTIDLLSFLAGKFDALRVLIVVTYRPSDMLLAKHPFLQIKPDLQARGACREVSLEFLTETEIADYLTLEFPRHAFPPDFAKLIHAKTEGNPLFMADLVRYLRDRGVIANTSGVWKLEQTLPAIERELPESVRGMIERKIAQLGEEDTKLLTAASVQGYSFDSAVVARALQLDADEVEERLEKLERVFAFVKLTSEAEFPNGTLTLKYRFVHGFYQNALYAGLRATRKATLCRDVAQALEACHGTRSANVANELALLWEAARDYERAADAFLQAARNAAQINAHREAVQLAERGLEAAGKLPETPERDGQELDLQLTLGLAWQSAQSWAAPEAGAAFDRARQLGERMGDDARLFVALSGVAMYHNVRAEYETVRGLGRQMMQLAQQSQNPALVVRCWMNLSTAYYWQGDFVAARQQGERTLALDRREYHQAYLSIANEDVGITLRRFHSYCLWHLGYADQALALAREAVALAAPMSHPLSLGGAYLAEGFVLSLLRDWQSCRQNIEKVLSLAEEYALGDMLNFATPGYALNQALEKPSEATIEKARQTIASLHAKGVLLWMTWLLGLLGEVLWRASRTAEGLETIQEAMALVERGERFYEAELWRIKGELLLQAASEAEAESCFQQAITIAQRQSAKSWELRAATSLARLWQRQGKTAEARQILAEIYGWFTEGFDMADLRNAKALLESLQG